MWLCEERHEGKEGGVGGGRRGRCFSFQTFSVGTVSIGNSLVDNSSVLELLILGSLACSL